MNAIEFDVTEQLDTFNKLSSSMPFIISKSMNDLSFQKGRKAISKEMNDKFESRSKPVTSKNAIKIKKSKKENLNITLYYHLGKINQKAKINKTMGLQQFGGTELPSNKKLAIPVRKTLKKYANVPMDKAIPKSLRIETIMQKAPRNRSDAVYKAKGVKPFIKSKGVFIRTNEGLKLLYVFADKAKHTKRLLKMQKTIERTFNVNLERYINRQYLKLLKG